MSLSRLISGQSSVLNRQWLILFFVICNLFFASSVRAADLTTDTDGDGLSDYKEVNIYGTSIYLDDTDKDGFKDGEEVSHGYSPLKAKLKLKEVDTDKDGLNDDWELKLGSNPLIKDTDGDGVKDGDEVKNGTSPTSKDAAKVEKRIAVDVAKFDLLYYYGATLLDSIKVSTGIKSMPTPRGEFTVLKKVPSKNYGGTGYDFYLPNTKWNLHFTTGKNGLRYYVHGAYWHNLFGIKNVSHGCVNVAYKDMERLYNWADVGTKVVIK